MPEDVASKFDRIVDYINKGGNLQPLYDFIKTPDGRRYLSEQEEKALDRIQDLRKKVFQGKIEEASVEQLLLMIMFLCIDINAKVQDYYKPKLSTARLTVDALLTKTVNEKLQTSLRFFADQLYGEVSESERVGSLTDWDIFRIDACFSDVMVYKGARLHQPGISSAIKTLPSDFQGVLSRIPHLTINQFLSKLNYIYDPELKAQGVLAISNFMCPTIKQALSIINNKDFAEKTKTSYLIEKLNRYFLVLCHRLSVDKELTGYNEGFVDKLREEYGIDFENPSGRLLFTKKYTACAAAQAGFFRGAESYSELDIHIPVCGGRTRVTKEKLDEVVRREYKYNGKEMRLFRDDYVVKEDSDGYVEEFSVRMEEERPRNITYSIERNEYVISESRGDDDHIFYAAAILAKSLGHKELDISRVPRELQKKAKLQIKEAGIRYCVLNPVPLGPARVA